MDTSIITYHPDFKTATAEGDVLLLSSDGEHFRIPTLILRTASGFFRSTLGLPQRTPETPSQANIDVEAAIPEPIVIPLPESSFVVETLCRILCFHGIDPLVALPHYIAATDLIYAAEKYELHCVTSFVRAAVTAPRFLEDPLRLYALSCRYNWASERQEAALRTLDLDFTDNLHDEALRSLDSCKDLLSLMRLPWARKTLFRRILDSDVFAASKNPAKCSRCNGHITPTAWREFKWMLLDEVVRIPSGRTIKVPGYFDTPAVAAVFQTKCIHCNRMCMDKENVMSEIMKAIDSLPTSL